MASGASSVPDGTDVGRNFNVARALAEPVASARSPDPPLLLGRTMRARPRPSKKRSKRGLVAACAASLLLLSGGLREARADGNADEADLHFEIAAEAYARGEYRLALEHFLFSNRLVANKNVVFNIARTYEKLGDREQDPEKAARRYADAHRHYVDALDGEVDEKTKGELNASLSRISPKVSVLRVETNPPDAIVYIDRKDLGSRGRTPRPLALPAGRYRVIVEKPGYEPAVVENVEAKRGEETKVALTLREVLGTVHVDVEGAKNALVHVGDEKEKPSCSAPCDFKMPPGTYLLYFTQDGFQGDPRQIVVPEKGLVKTTARMKPLSGSVVVEADEQGAVVEIDGAPSGFTPAVIQNVAVGKHRVTVKARGFAPVEQPIEVRTNERVELLGLRLEPLRQVQAVSRITESIEDAPSSLTIIEGDELRAFGYPTIAEALRGVRGVAIGTDRAYWSATIRGIGEPNDFGKRLLVLSDGAILNDDILNSSYIGSDGRTDLADVERIEVVRGPGSLLYGTGAFSGVVNLVPHYRDNPTGVTAGASTYENRVARGRASVHVNFSKDAGMYASVSASRSEGFELPIELNDPGAGPASRTIQEVDKFYSVTTSGSAWWKDLTAQWFYTRRKQQIPIGAVGTGANDPRTFYFDERALGEIRYEPKINQYFQLFSRVHANHYHFNGIYALKEPANPLSEDYYGSWFGVEARAVITPIKQLRITAGGEGQFHPFAALRGTEVEQDLETPIEGGEYMNEEVSYNLGAAYAVLEASPVSWFRVSAGVRVDIYSTFGAIPIPRGALIFKPTKGGVLKLMGGRAFRAPSIYEQFYNDGGFTQTKGEDEARGLELKPESIVSSEIEYSQRFLENWVALASAHTSYIENIINTIPDEPGSDVVRYANSDVPALTVGGEVELRREWRQGWMLSGFYGYQRAQYLNPTDPAQQENPRLINAPEHLAGIKGVVPVVPELASVGARATLEAPRRINLEGDDTTDTGVVADVTLSGVARRYGLRYVVGIYNLFDWRTEVPVADTYASRTMPQNGRTVLVDLSLTVP